MTTILTLPGSSSPCAFCEDLPWPSVPLKAIDERPSLWSRIEVTVQGLQDSANRGCLLCQFFWTVLINDARRKKGEPNELSTCSFKIGMKVFDGRVIVFLGLEKGTFCLEQLHCFFEPVPLDRTDRQISQEVQQIRSFEELTIAEELRDIVDHEINPWMDDCCHQKADHEYCGVASGIRQTFQLSDKEKILPRRYLDLGNPEDHSVKLVDVHTLALADRTQYLILSYCWGAGNAAAETTDENLQARYDGIADVALPQTIQDAIRLTRMMGFRYLWVDAICIVQSTRQDDQSEFKNAAKRMGHYYANALCCISASRARDSCEGFLSRRPSAKHPLQPITIQLNTCSSAQTHIMTLIGCAPRNAIMSMQLATSPLRKRGWYLQELLLSQRILHWTEFGLYRECRSSWFVEGQRTRWIGSQDSQDRWLSNPRDCLDLSKEGRLTSTGWNELIEIFSCQSLTFAEDRNHAILGLASLFAQDLGDGHVYGLFPSFLSEGLAWHSDEDPQNRKPRQISFPGWSWASNGQVRFGKLDQRQLFARINHSHLVQGPSTSASASVDHLKLFVRAPLFTLTYTDEHLVKIKGMNHIDWVVAWSSHYLDNPLGLASSLIEASELVDKPGTTVHWILLGCRNNHYCGLLVQRVADSGENTFVRYGLSYLTFLGGADIEQCYAKFTDSVLI